MGDSSVTVRPIDVPPGSGPLHAALTDARAQRRPLLLLDAAGEAGRAWGMLLSHAAPDLLARICACDLYCAGEDEVAALGIDPIRDGRLRLRALIGGDGDAWLIEGTAATLLPPDHLDPLILALESLADALDARLQPRHLRALQKAIRDARAVPWSDDRAWLHRATLPLEQSAGWLIDLASSPRHGAPTAQDQITQVRAALAAAFFAPGSSDRLDDRWRGEDAWFEARLASLSALARAVTDEAGPPDDPPPDPARWRRLAPPGSQWWLRSACCYEGPMGPDGYAAEDPGAPGFDCGMAHVPALAGRFLTAYTAPAREAR